MKLRERFVLKSKEDEAKEIRLRRTLTLTVLFSAVVVPLLNDGVLYTLIEYTASDVAAVFLNLILRYIVVFTRYACIFVSFASVITSILHYGYKDFKTPHMILFAGSFVTFIAARFGSWVFCYEHGLINTEAADVVSVSFEYFCLAAADIIKNAVLIVIFCRFANKVRAGKTTYVIPDCEYPEKPGAKEFFKSAFSSKKPFLKLSAFAAGVQALFEITVNFVTVTVFQLIADGLPETGLDYAALLSGYALIIPLCAAGAAVCVLLCSFFSRKKPRAK